MKKIYLFPLFLLLVIGVDAQNFWSQDAVPSGGGVTRLDRTDAGTLYALMQDWDLQVYRSSDDGLSWSYVPTPVSGTSTSFNGFFVGKSGALYTVQDDNIQRSTDNGVSWSAINPPGFNTGDPIYLAGVFILEISPNVLLLGSGYNDGGIWRSVDGGISWTHVYDTFTGFAGHNRLLQVSDQEVFAISASYSDDFLYSSDAGISWTLIDGNNFFIGESGGMLARKSGGPLFACSESTVIRSTDGGYNWEDISPALPNNGAFAGLSSFCFSPNGRVFLGGLSGSYYSDDDGLSWIPVPNRHLSAFPMVGSLPDGVLFFFFWGCPLPVK